MWVIKPEFKRVFDKNEDNPRLPLISYKFYVPEILPILQKHEEIKANATVVRGTGPVKSSSGKMRIIGYGVYFRINNIYNVLKAFGAQI